MGSVTKYGELNFDDLGNLLVALGSPLSGEDKTRDLMLVADGAYQYQNVMPLSGVGMTSPVAITPSVDAAGWGKTTFATASLTAGVKRGMTAYSASTAAGIQEGSRLTDVTGTSGGAGTLTLSQPHPAAIAANAVNFVWGSGMNSDVPLATATGQAGDILKGLLLRVVDPNYSLVTLKDGFVAHPETRVTTTGSTDTMVVLNSSMSVASNTYTGCICSLTFTPTGYGSSITLKRRIVAHTATLLFLDHPLPSAPGSGITVYIEDPAYSFTVLANGSASQVCWLPVGKRSKAGGWRLSVDIGVGAIAVGKFS